MKMTVDAQIMKQVFKDYDRNYYSVNGLNALLDYYDGIDPNIEFDPVAICCDCSEYGEHGAILSLNDLANDYGYLLNREEYGDENEYLKALIEVLEDHTTVLHVCNGNYIVFEF